MEAQRITKEVIENLENNKYAIFKNNSLIDLLNVSHIVERNYSVGKRVYRKMGDRDYCKFENLQLTIRIFWKDCYIIPTSEVKLNNSISHIENIEVDNFN